MKIYKPILYIFSLLLFIEICLRILGVKPFPERNSGSDEDLSSYHIGYVCNDPEIGILPCESKDKIINGPTGQFTITHLKDGSRNCGSNASDTTSPILLITGDSNTHGDWVDDSEHVGYKLQLALPQYHVINRSIPGSGTISQWLVLRESLKHYTPQIVVATCASYHNERNVYGQSMRKIFRISKSMLNVYSFPSMVIEKDSFILKYNKYQYDQIPLSNYFAICEFYNIIAAYFADKKLQADIVTKHIWEEYINTCKLNRIKLCVMVLTDDQPSEELIAYFKRNHVEIIRANLTDSLTLRPLDSHPNKAGHIFMTHSILSKLDSLKWLAANNFK